jgi:hypothetical protein
MPKKQSHQTQDILTMIRQRQDPNYKPPPDPTREIKRSDWYKFTKDFVEEVDGKRVNKETGMTDKEYLDYLKDSASIAGSTIDQDQKDWQTRAQNSTKSLREFLQNLDAGDNNFDDLFDSK